MDRGHDLKATLEDPGCKELHLKFGNGHMMQKTAKKKKIGKVREQHDRQLKLEDIYRQKEKKHTHTHTRSYNKQTS